MGRVRIEFTVEPFVEGRPGPHVKAAIDAASRRGLEVDVGPFSTIVDVPGDDIGEAVAELVTTALDHGASRVSLQVEPVAGAPEDGSQ